MATTSSAAQKRKANFPNLPKRGQIKLNIFNGLVKSVVSPFSKARESPGKITGNGSNGGAGDSASSTPPPSAYNSDDVS